MPDQEMGPDRLTPKGLPSARHGYEHKAVERLLEEARRAWAAAEAEQRRLLQEIDRAGGLDYLARDLGAVGTDLGRLLGDAQEASRGLRERARVDSIERVTTAAAEARRIVAEAEEQAFRIRSDAWSAGSELLRQAEEKGRAVIREVDDEVLIVRAGAEQEAHRLVATARREAQDGLRAARFEAERAMIEMRAQAEQMAPVEIPAPAPEPALPESADSGRPHRRHHGGFPPPVATADVRGIRVIQPESPRRQPAPGDIDHATYGDALAAEVQALWESGEVEVAPAEPAEAEAAPPPAWVGVPAGTVEPAGEAPAVVEAAVEGEVEWEEAAPVEAAPAEPAPEEGLAEPGSPEAPHGFVDDLFARLRGSHHHRHATDRTEKQARATPTGGEAAAPSAGTTRIAAAPVPGPDPLEVRERLLLPVQNRALRRVKEGIVELQNAALDSLRVSGAWEGSGPTLAALAPALDPVAEEGAEAGTRAVAVFTGGEPPAPVITTRSAILVKAMADDLAGQAATALAGMAGGGPLEVAAAVSRVFRAWRADEAERWVRSVAYAAYHDSLLAGLAVAGVGTVAAVAHGLLCPECPALRGASWDPAGNPPPGTARPPAHPGCVCTVAPS